MYISRLETLEDYKSEIGKTAYLQHVSKKLIIFSQLNNSRCVSCLTSRDQV